MLTNKDKISVATDCSGIEAPIQALKQLNIPFRHVWSCDNDPRVRKTLLANYSPEIMFTDITTRDHSAFEKDIALYCASAPCQPFSSIGKREGVNHKKGMIFWDIADTIRHVQPKRFILENVKGLLSIEKGETFKNMLEVLHKMPYTISWKVLNTKDYNLPHNRPRVFICGIRNDIPIDFEFPEPVPLKADIMSCLDQDLPVEPIIAKRQAILDELGIDQSKNYFVTPFSDKRWCNPMLGILPCMTATFAKRYSIKLRRYLTPREHARLQGFPDDFKIVVPPTSAYRQFGNTISVNVLKAIFTGEGSQAATARGAVLRTLNAT
jgi:DNA (cytosine-5)-methyltransferase 1